MSLPNFELITELQMTARRDFPVAAPSILSPLDSAALVEGEWLELDNNYKLARGGTGAGTAEEGTNAAVFPVHTEKGRYDTQAVQKVNVIFAHDYEAETTIVNPTGLVIGDALTVQNVNINGVVRRGLAKRLTQSTGTPAVKSAVNPDAAVVGYVTKVTGSKVRFIHRGVVKAF
jgi:hypothetical protein